MHDPEVKEERPKVPFSSLPLLPSVAEAIASMGFEFMTPIQDQAIPLILQGRDIVGCAQTGTGKTAAFVIPMLEKVAESSAKGVKVLVICPTRELAVQIDQQVMALAYFTDASSIAIYGGKDAMSWEQEKTAFTSGVDIIVATPGRLLSHTNFEYGDLSQVELLILDEADRMLDMGFHDDIMRIVKKLPQKRQTLLFSATMPPAIRKMANVLLHDPAEVTIAISRPADAIDQKAYMAHDGQKIKLLEHLLKDRKVDSGIVFVGTKSGVREVARSLQKLGLSAEPISSDLEQSQREVVLNDFRNRRVKVLVATDVMSRGIDIEDIELVVNFDVPRDAEDYVHRIGRTARAGAKGSAITFINEDDCYGFLKIERLIGREIVKDPLPDWLGQAPVYDPSTRRRGGRPGQNSQGRGGRDSGRAQHSRPHQPKGDRPPRPQGEGGDANGSSGNDRRRFKKRRPGANGPRPGGDRQAPQNG